MSVTRHRALRLNELERLTPEELQAEKMRYKQAVCDIEGAVEQLKREGLPHIPASVALRHYRASLGFIAEIGRRRHIIATADQGEAAVRSLYLAARQFTEDHDSMSDTEHDASFDRLCAAVKRITNLGNEIAS